MLKEGICMGMKNKFLVLIAVIAAILIIVSGIGYYNSQKQLTESIESRLAMIVDQQAYEVDSWMMSKANKMTMIADTFLHMPEDIINAKGSVMGLANDKDVQNFYNGRENGLFIRSNEADILPPDYNPTTRGWYVNAKNSGALIFTDVYMDIGTKKNVISAAVPYKDAMGKTQGVLAMDISLDIMNEIAKNINIDKHGKGFIIDKAGVVIAQGEGGIEEKTCKKVNYLKVIGKRCRLMIKETLK